MEDGAGVSSLLSCISDDDLSGAVLKQTFGDNFFDAIGTTGEADDGNPMAKMFSVFNKALIAVALFWFAFNAAAATVQTAEGGEFMGKRFSSTWIPIRFGIGITSLVPIFGGFCGAQLIFMWFAKMATGLANIMTLVAIPTMSGPAYSVNNAITGSNPSVAIEQLFKSEICYQSVNQALSQANGLKDYAPVGIDLVGETIRIRDGILPEFKGTKGFYGYITYTSEKGIRRGTSVQDGDAACGGVSFFITQHDGGPTGNKIEDSYDDAGSLSIIPWMDNYSVAEMAANTTMEGLLEARVKTAALASEVIDSIRQGKPYTKDIKKELANIENQYRVDFYNKTEKFFDGLDDKTLDLARDSIQQYGWMMLGSWYQIIARNLTGVDQLFNTTFNVFDINTERTALSAAMEEAIYIQRESTLRSENMEERLTDALGSARGARFAATLLLKDDSSGDLNGSNLKFIGSNPIFQLKEFGDTLLTTAGTIMTVVLGAALIEKVATILPMGKVASYASKANSLLDRNKTDEISKTALSQFGSFILLIGTALMLFGFMLATYIPMLPFIIWFGGLLSWFAVTVEALIAAPIGAFIHMDTEGEGLGQRTQHSYLFLLNVLLRPALMVFGFFAATQGVMVMGNLLLFLFGPALVAAESGSLMTGLFMIVGYSVIIISLALTLSHSMFNLIYIVPDQVISWAGGQTNTQLGRDTDDRAKQTFVGGFSKTERAVELSKSGDTKPKQNAGASGGASSQAFKS